MSKRCVLLGHRFAGLAGLLKSYGYDVDTLDENQIDERDMLAFIQESPFAVVLPLSLPDFASLRLAELVALTRQPIRLILVSGTRAPNESVEALFDVHLNSSEDLLDVLKQNEWTHSFERRHGTVDSAIQQLLKDASCFWISRHSESWQTLVDYQRTTEGKRREFTVLFLAADPSDQVRLRLIQEYTAIQTELTRQSNYTFTLKQVFSSRPDELSRVLLKEKPHIVHFSGHGDSSGRLCFEDAGGSSWPADKAAIAQMFEPCRRYVKCVLLNACYSAEQAELIGAWVEYAAGLEPEISDDAAIALSKGFYGALSVSGKISTSLDAARANLRLLAGGECTLHCVKRGPEFRGGAD